jgi:antitoxin ParD1/3/4
MPTMNISLPETMKEFVEVEVSEGGYNTTSEYFRALVRDAQKRKAEERLVALLLEGLESGESTPMTGKEWVDIREEVRRRAAIRSGQKASK